MDFSVIVDFLDDIFDLKKLKNGEMTDFSMMSRKELIPKSQQNEFLSSFFNIMNGLLLQSTEEVNSIVLSTFLSDNVISELSKKECQNSLLIVHHLFDMNCGTPDEMNGVPFHFISSKSIEIIKKNKISVYASHLPFDLQECRFNTSLAFAKKLNLSDTYSPLCLNSLKNIGYQTEIDFDIGSYLKRKFDTIYRYGNGEDSPMQQKKTVIIAGVISNIDMLKELEKQGFTHIICGDVFVCIPSERFRNIYEYIKKTNLCIYCLSHNLSESYGLEMLGACLSEQYKSISCENIFENEVWK